MDATLHCDCPLSGFCKEFGHGPGTRTKEICSGTSNLSPVKAAAYRRNWTKIKEQSTLQATMAFATATAKWLAAGRPKRTQTEMETTFEVCKTCEHFTPGTVPETAQCALCGCNLAKLPSVFNKIEMATEHCPVGKW